MRERKLTTLIAGPIIFESSSRETTISRRSGEHFPGYGPGIGRLDVPLDAFRENLDPEHRGAIAEEIFAQVKDDFGGLGQNLLLQ
ncbi:hypothetical protein [Corynebacterium pacaense]|uniref:hypothetical protein n=1 Tax=Corynebacterium pacaense TaxID=1816684 RepID=UPI0009BBCF49|nr:hypothetical protein [Corynebacterium pacaense]